MTAARVSIFLPSLAGGGAERSISIIANGLAARGADVSLVLGTASGPFLRDVSDAVRLVDLRSASVVSAVPGLVRHLRSTQPTALLSALSHANIAASVAWWLAGSRARLVLSERAHFSSVLDQHRDLRMQLTRQLMRLTYPMADLILAVSEGVASDLAEYIRMPLDRIETIYNPVVDQRMLQLSESMPSHRWLAQRETPVILGAGRLIPQKDFSTLIRAFALVRRTRLLRLVILGEGEMRDELKSLADALGVGEDVDLSGFDPNPFSAMRTTDVFVLSSRFEGLPGVLIQAMACGTRVVSTDCPSGPREILESGRWGRLVPPTDPPSLADAIESALDDVNPPDVKTRAAAFSVDAAVTRYARALAIE
jgi:glycosyltransferase involved in cell wall biosynthesis